MAVRRSWMVCFSLGMLVSLLAACAPVAQSALTPAAPTPAALPLPTAVPDTSSTSLRIRVNVDEQADGASVVSDADNSYQFTLAKDWMAIPVSKQHIDRLAQASPAPDAEFLSLARKLDDQKMDAFRVVGLDTDSKLAGAANPTLLLVTAIPDRISAALPMPELAKMIEDTVFTGAPGVQREVVQNARGMNIAVVEGPYEYLSTQGETLPTRSKVIGFQANYRVILIQFIAPVESAAEVLPGTDQIIDTIRAIKP